MDNYGRIDALLASAEARLLALLREIGRRREHLASSLRKASNDIIDGEFKELGPDRESVGVTENSQPTETADHGAAGEAGGEEIDPDSHPAATAVKEDRAELADDLDQGHQGEGHQGEGYQDEGHHGEEYYPPAPTPS